jgi:hypothetical protein
MAIPHNTEALKHSSTQAESAKSISNLKIKKAEVKVQNDNPDQTRRPD